MKKPFSAWIVGLPYYGGAMVAGLGLTVLLWPHPVAWVGIVVLLLGMYALYFFRDPERPVPQEPGLVVSSADGVVVGIESLEETPHYEGPCVRISVFLSLFDVHVNRSPLPGTVRAVEHRPGKFLDARLPESSEVNEANCVFLDTAHGPVTVRQISGLVARRIICRCEPGDSLATGERFGMIRFGSRTELYLPKGVEVVVQLKQAVRGGETVVARFTSAANAKAE